MRKRLVILIPFLLLLFSSCGQKKTGQISKNTKNLISPAEYGIEVFDSTALNIVDPNSNFQVLANGFYWSEGPLWVDELQALLFSDVPANKIYKWTEKDGLSLYLESSGHTHEKNSNKGSNGLNLDLEDNLLICQHGDRRIAKMDASLNHPQAQYTTIADTYNKKKFNSPNDLAIDEDGNIYFTDPPYGRPENETGEIGLNGVFKVHPDGETSLLLDSLTMPNGIALSLNNKIVYINQSDPDKPFLYRYTINTNGMLEEGRILFNFSELSKNNHGLPDGLKIHKSGTIFATGPGGVHLISPEGKHLAVIKTGKATANCAFDTDYKNVYLTTTDMLIRVKLK